jgi:hypothetical protein
VTLYHKVYNKNKIRRGGSWTWMRYLGQRSLTPVRFPPLSARICCYRDCGQWDTPVCERQCLCRGENISYCVFLFVCFFVRVCVCVCVCFVCLSECLCALLSGSVRCVLYHVFAHVSVHAYVLNTFLVTSVTNSAH